MDNLARQLIHKVPLFFGFKPQQMKVFLDICKPGRIAPGETLCEYNTTSNRLFILLEGELDILSPDGRLLTTLRPITTVGEMGFVSRRPRSATVKASKASHLLRVDYHEFEELVERNAELRAKVYRNMVRILADRISDANDLVMRYRKLYESSQKPEPAEKEEPAAGQETAEQAAKGEGEPGQETEEEQRQRLLEAFYQLASLAADEAQQEKDRKLYDQLRQGGYTPIDIEYAIKWTVRHIPAVKRFNLVKLSIEEAFEDKWSM
jgi:CRP-like cAMP-binding protein